MGPGVVWIGRTRVLFPLIYKRNLTSALYAESIREEIVWTRMTVAEEKSRRTRSAFCPHCEALADDAWLRPANLLGRYMVTMVTPTFGMIRKTAAAVDSRRSLLRAAVALRLYSLEHDGTLPASLAELVPEYLPAVPRDFADGGEIRYSREARALWSVGVNNLRITAPDQEIKDAKREAVFWLKFAEPAEAGAGETEAKPAGF